MFSIFSKQRERVAEEMIMCNRRAINQTLNDRHKMFRVPINLPLYETYCPKLQIKFYFLHIYVEIYDPTYLIMETLYHLYGCDFNFLLP